jgi:hypothetical protein
MKRIKQIVSLGTFIMFFGISVQATDSRKFVLSGTVYHEFTPLGMVITSVDALLNPTYMLHQSNYVNIDYDGATYSGYGFFKMKPFGLPGVFGLQIGKRYGSYRSGIWTGSGENISDLNDLVAPICAQSDVGVDGIDVTDLNSIRSFGIYYALPLGEKLKVGFGFNYVGRGVSGNRINDPQSASTEKDDIFKKQISSTMFRAGIEHKLNNKINLLFDIGIGKPEYSYEYTIASDSTEDNEKASFSGWDLDANLRADYRINNNTSLIANVSYFSYGGSLEIDPDTGTSDDSTTYRRAQQSFTFLIGPLFHGDGHNFGFQAGFMSDRSNIEMSLEASDTDTQKNNPRTTSFPILRLLAEKRLLKWFTMRASVTYMTFKEKTLNNSDTDPATEDWKTVSGQPTSTLSPAFGFTIDFNSGFFIDAYMFDSIFLKGPYLFTGNTSGPNLNAGVSIGIRI